MSVGGYYCLMVLSDGCVGVMYEVVECGGEYVEEEMRMWRFDMVSACGVMMFDVWMCEVIEFVLIDVWLWDKVNFEKLWLM